MYNLSLTHSLTHSLTRTHARTRALGWIRPGFPLPLGLVSKLWFCSIKDCLRCAVTAILTGCFNATKSLENVFPYLGGRKMSVTNLFFLVCVCVCLQVQQSGQVSVVLSTEPEEEVLRHGEHSPRQVLVLPS